MEGIHTFVLSRNSVSDESRQFCAAVELPSLTLAGVVKGMIENADCQSNTELKKRYTGKVLAVLRLVVKALRHLHTLGLVHGDIKLDNVGKYGDKWKIAELLGVYKIGDTVPSSRLSDSSAPELLKPKIDTLSIDRKADPAHDTWSFGKLCFESLTGESLFKVDEEDDTVPHEKASLTSAMLWNESDVNDAKDFLLESGISESATDLIAHCLSPDAIDRPAMDEILAHPVWKEIQKRKS